MVSEGTMFDWSGVYFESVVQPGPGLVQTGYVAFMSTMALGRFTADRMVMRFGAVRVLRASGILIAAGLLVAVLFPVLWSATLGFLLVGLGTSSIVPLCYSMAGKSKKMIPSVALASVSTIGFLGFLLGPPVIRAYCPCVFSQMVVLPHCPGRSGNGVDRPVPEEVQMTEGMPAFPGVRHAGRFRSSPFFRRFAGEVLSPQGEVAVACEMFFCRCSRMI